MHHGYVDRAAIADSVLMDLLTLQQARASSMFELKKTCECMPARRTTLLLTPCPPRSATCLSAPSPASSAASPSSSWSPASAWCRRMPAWTTPGAATSWRCWMYRDSVQSIASRWGGGVGGPSRYIYFIYIFASKTFFRSRGAARSFAPRRCQVLLQRRLPSAVAAAAAAAVIEHLKCNFTYSNFRTHGVLPTIGAVVNALSLSLCLLLLSMHSS
jgi:hypothetical protein